MGYHREEKLDWGSALGESSPWTLEDESKLEKFCEVMQDSVQNSLESGEVVWDGYGLVTVKPKPVTSNEDTDFFFPNLQYTEDGKEYAVFQADSPDEYWLEVLEWDSANPVLSTEKTNPY